MADVKFVNVCKFTAASAGTGSFVVSGPVTGYQTPLTAGASNFNYRYRAESLDLTQWENGVGTYTSSTVTFTRTPSINSAGGSSAINFTNAPQVGFVISADDIQATGQIPGTNTNDNASAGNVGEFVVSTISTAASVGVASGVTANVTSISLSAGDWDIRAQLGVVPTGTLSAVIAAVSSVSATAPTDNLGDGAYSLYQMPFTAASRQVFPAGTRRVTLSASATYYFVAQVTYGTSASVYGIIGARRMR
jgi:hypothetical protein